MFATVKIRECIFIKPIFHHYTKWEDYKHGMYSTSKVNFDELIENSVRLFKDRDKLYNSMKNVTLEWVYSTEENLSNITQNARPWLGRASCCYTCGATEDVVRVAWFKLTSKEMDIANDIADKVIEEWRSSREYKQLELFGGFEVA